MATHAIVCPILAQLSSLKGGHLIKSTTFLLAEVMARKEFGRTFDSKAADHAWRQRAGHAAVVTEPCANADASAGTTPHAHHNGCVATAAAQTNPAAVTTACVPKRGASSLSSRVAGELATEKLLAETCAMMAESRELEARLKRVLYRTAVLEQRPADRGQVDAHTAQRGRGWLEFERLCDHPVEDDYHTACRRPFRALLTAAASAWRVYSLDWHSLDVLCQSCLTHVLCTHAHAT